MRRKIRGLMLICIISFSACTSMQKTDASVSKAPKPTMTSILTKSTKTEGPIRVNSAGLEDWDLGTCIPAGFFENAEDGLKISLYFLASAYPSDFQNDIPELRIVAGNWEENWGILTVKLECDVEDGVQMLDDMKIRILSPEVRMLEITISGELAKFYYENGGMYFPCHKAIVTTAEVTKLSK